MIDNAPPWVVEEVRAAQAFIDREWSQHVHDTEHVQDRDWRLPEGLIRVLWGTKRPGLCAFGTAPRSRGDRTSAT